MHTAGVLKRATLDIYSIKRRVHVMLVQVVTIVQVEWEVQQRAFSVELEHIVPWVPLQRHRAQLGTVVRQDQDQRRHVISHLRPGIYGQILEWTVPRRSVQLVTIVQMEPHRQPAHLEIIVQRVQGRNRRVLQVHTVRQRRRAQRVRQRRVAAVLTCQQLVHQPPTVFVQIAACRVFMQGVNMKLHRALQLQIVRVERVPHRVRLDNGNQQLARRLPIVYVRRVRRVRQVNGNRVIVPRLRTVFARRVRRVQLDNGNQQLVPQQRIQCA